MRSILILLVTICISGTAASSEEVARRNAETISIGVESMTGSTTLTVEDQAETPFEESVMRLVVLPDGASAPKVELLTEEDAASAIQVTAGEPMILRGMKVLPLTISRSQSSGAGKAAIAPSSCRIGVTYDETNATTPAATRHGRGFYQPFANLLAGGVEVMPQSAELGSYLIITAPLFLEAANRLATWKHEKGYEVHVATTDETGITTTSIKEYVSDRYHNSPNPPTYLLLVGDVDRLPTWDFHHNVSDHPYTLVDGEDFLPDLHVGRLSAANSNEAETIVAKILRHERDPYVDGGTEWFTNGLVVAGDYGSSTPRAVSRWCREQMMTAGFAAVDSVYYPRYWDGVRFIRDAIDAGVSLVTYRGWAYGQRGWEPPHFTVDNIPELRNGWMLPVVFSFVCLNNDFGWENPCFGEVWVREGSPEEPRGAVAFIGNSEDWSHTRYNDAAAIGAFTAIGDHGTRGLGEILLASKTEILKRFPTLLYFSEHGGISVEFYFHIYSLLGDPDLELWTSAPRVIDVGHVEAIPVGANFLDVTVEEVDGEPAIAGVRVGITQGTALLGCGWTDETGLAHIPVQIDSDAEPVLITLTGENVRPYQAEVPVTSTGALLSFKDVNIGEQAGNGDGTINPGETITLEVTLGNMGDAAATEVSATLTAPDGGWATVISDYAGFPDIPAGGEAVSNNPFTILVDNSAEDRLSTRLELELTTDGATSTADLFLSASAPALTYEKAEIDGEGILIPGATSGFTIAVRNDGSLASSDATAILRTLDPEHVAVIDSVSSFAPIDTEGAGTSETTFTVSVDPDTPTGLALQFTLECTTDEGYMGETSFGLIVGPADFTAPLGPDSYGYYAYDATDTDYPDGAPLYDWVYCSTAYGGDGTKIELRDNSTAAVELPFPFTYYGTVYDSILVSDNGWISFDLDNYLDFYNWPMPNGYGSGAQVAPFWDNLDPEKGKTPRDEEALQAMVQADGVYTLYDDDRHMFVVEWSRMPNHIAEFNDPQTFELILYDPAYYGTPTGDGIIDFQYKKIVNNDTERMFATIGIENHDETDGLQYTYCNVYPETAVPVSSGLAIRITTQPAVYSPFDFADFTATRQTEGVLLSWEPIDDRPRGRYRIYRAEQDGEYELVSSLPLTASTRSFLDETADPESRYTYKVGSFDPVGRETRVGPFEYSGRVSKISEIALAARTVNPFRGKLELSYATPAKGAVQLKIYDLTGRLVRTLVDQTVDAGVWNVTWDGRDDRGHDLASGIYLCKMQANGKLKTLKTTLLR